MIKLLIADDHALMREGLKQLFALGGIISVVAEASSGAQIFDILRRTEVDLVLLDISMPGISGASLINHIRLQEKSPRILVLSMHNELQVARSALSAGASGYLTKDSDPETLIAAIVRVAAGGQFMDAGLAEQMAFDVGHATHELPHTLLSNREFEIFDRLVRGQSVNQIAEDLIISNKTVSTHKARLMQKMRCSNSAQLVRYALSHSLLD
jgi:DNA-binding NarL/FixJ family response regulator